MGDLEVEQTDVVSPITGSYWQLDDRFELSSRSTAQSNHYCQDVQTSKQQPLRRSVRIQSKPKANLIRPQSLPKSGPNWTASSLEMDPVSRKRAVLL